VALPQRSSPELGILGGLGMERDPLAARVPLLDQPIGVDEACSCILGFARIAARSSAVMYGEL
jgi:hypothetical protein